MKIKDNFVLRKVADVWVVLPLGAEAVDFHGMLTLNETGALLWRVLERGSGLEEMADALVNDYAVSREQAVIDSREFCEELKNNGCIEF